MAPVHVWSLSHRPKCQRLDGAPVLALVFALFFAFAFALVEAFLAFSFSLLLALLSFFFSCQQAAQGLPTISGLLISGHGR